MEQCTLFWLAITLFAMVIALIVIASIALHRLAGINELVDRLRDKVDSVHNRMSKLETATDWFLQKDGMKLDMMNWRWFVTSMDDGKLRDWLDRKEDRKNSALAEAIYKGYIQAMRDYAQETKKEAKKKK